MTELILVAASGLAREVLAVARAMGGTEVSGYLDDQASLWGTKVDGVPVLGGLSEVQRYESAALLVCAGKGDARRALVDRLATMGVTEDRFATAVHPSVDVPEGCTIGAGSIVLAQAALSAAVTVGRHVVVMPNATLTHGDVIGDFATICAGVALGGDVHIGAGAYLGMSVCVRERVIVGEGSVLGMGAVVLGDVPPGETWVGMPARKLGTA